MLIAKHVLLMTTGKHLLLRLPCHLHNLAPNPLLPVSSPPFPPAATSPVAGAVILGEPRAAAVAAARRLGLHYLQRYFYLIAFR